MLRVFEKIAKRIKGHDPVQSYIQEALLENRLPQALLFSGPSGIGKRSMAWALAQRLLCDTSCGKCQNCLGILARQSENVFCLKQETLQIRLKEVKAIPPFLYLQSFARAKVVLIDSAEALNAQASNFLLKIVEEPPPKSFFFLISSQPSRLSLTLRSRLQNLRFQPLPKSVLRELSGQDTEEWMISGSRGRLDLMAELKNQTELRERAFALWTQMFQKPFSSLEILKNIGNRKESLEICRYWQQILRDARFLKMNCSEELIHKDKLKSIERLSSLSAVFLDFLIQKTFEMERDLKANADYALCFENFAISIEQYVFQRYTDPV